MQRVLATIARNIFLPAVLLAFAVPAFGQTLAAIYVMKVEGGEVRKASHCDNRWLGSPAWSHDGKQLLYDAAPPDKNYRQCRIVLERLTPEGGRKNEAGEVGDPECIDLGFGCAPRWSPDDEQVALFLGPGHAGGGKPGVYVMNADGSGRKWICHGERPRWSPDGAKLACASRHEGFPSVYIYDFSSQEISRVLEQEYDQISGACWSPDGRRLAFIGYKGGDVLNGGRGDLAVVEAAASQRPNVVRFDRLGWQPDWSPDGKRLLAWIAINGQERLQLLDPEGREPRIELPGQAGDHNTDASFSPDGKWIVWGSNGMKQGKHP